jgi:oligopeptide transport system substrate-binding protein
MPDDYEAARKLLAEAGYPHGQGLPTVEVLSYTTEHAIKTLEVVQAVWAKELGFHIQIAPVEQKTLFSNSQTGNYTIAFSGWSADYPDPLTFLSCLHTGNGNNWAKYSNAKYDQLLDAAADSPDNKVRYEDFQQAEAILMHDAPLVPLYFGERPFLIQPSLHGWPDSKLQFKAFKNVWLGP